MKIQKTILRETLHVALAMLIGSALECAVFAVLGKFDASVALGAGYGAFFTILNFFLMGLSVQKTMQTKEGEKLHTKRSYTLRMLLLTAAVAAGVLIPQIHSIAVLIPFLLLKPAIYVIKLLEGAKGGDCEA